VKAESDVELTEPEFNTGRVSLIRCVSIPSLETTSYGLFAHGGVVARQNARFPRLAQASGNKLEKRARCEENSSTYTTRNRAAPRIQGKTGSSHGQSPSTTWRREETKTNFWKKTESNGILQIHQSHIPPDCRWETSCKKIPEPDRSRILPSILRRNESLVRSDPNGSPPSSPPGL